MALSRSLLAALVLGISAAGGGCSSADDAPAGSPSGSIRYELFEWTRELAPDTLAAIANVSTEDGSIRFRGSPAQLAGLKRGDVLVTGLHETTPNGLLRQVLEVTTDAGDTVVSTQPVAVQLAFKTLHARVEASTFALDGARAAGGTRSLGKHSTGTQIGGGQHIDWQVFDSDGKRDTKDDQLYVTGDVTGSLGFSVYIDLDWVEDPKKAAKELACAVSVVVCTPDLPDVRLGAEAHATAKAVIDVEGAAATSFDHDEFPIDGSKFDLPPLSIGPVAIYPEIDFVALVTGSATSRVHAKAGLEYSMATDISVGLKSGVQFNPPTFTKDVTPPTVDVTLTSELKASVGPRIKLLFWKTFGPSFAVQGYGKLHANTEQTPCWGLDVGAELVAGINLRIPWGLFGLTKLGRLLGLDGDIASKSFPPINIFNVPSILTGACGKIPDGIYPPGEGPTADVYKAPTFAPWSQRFDSDDFTFPFSAEVSATAIHASKAIDGTWLVGGLGFPGVIKLAEDGRLVWSKRMKLPRLLPGEVDDAEDAARSTLVAQAKNTNIWVATSRFTVMQLDQEGDVVWSRRYLPGNVALQGALEATALVSTDDGGALVTYSVRETPSDGPAVVLRLDRNGKLLFSKTFAYETPKTFVPSVIAADGGDVFVSGYSWESGSNIGHVARLRSDGSTVFAKKVGMCGSGRVRPGPGVRLASGAFAFSGTFSLAPEHSMLAQIAPDGSAGSAASWWTGSNVKDASTNALVQLPISGFLSLGVGVPVKQTSLLLASHDGQGLITWQRELLMGTDPAAFEVRPGALRMTNDGGVLVFAQAVNPALRSGLWVSKLPARTGEAAFDAAQVTTSAGTLVGESCALTLAPDTLALTDLPFETLEATNVVITEAPLDVTKLIP
jgi:hypothetical protein